MRNINYTLVNNMTLYFTHVPYISTWVCAQNNGKTRQLEANFAVPASGMKRMKSSC